MLDEVVEYSRHKEVGERGVNSPLNASDSLVTLGAFAQSWLFLKHAERAEDVALVEQAKSILEGLLEPAVHLAADVREALGRPISAVEGRSGIKVANFGRKP